MGWSKAIFKEGRIHLRVAVQGLVASVPRHDGAHLSRSQHIDSLQFLYKKGCPPGPPEAAHL